MSFANTNEMDVIVDKDFSTEITDANYEIQYEIVEYAYDHCTITVTVTNSSGSYSATATNNQGDCVAAQAAASRMARLMAEFN